MTTLCRECGQPFTPRRSTAAFCATECKRQFNNRRAMRGAELYDVWMSARFERSVSADAWSLMCRMASVFRAQDDAMRDGRKSWAPLTEVRMRKATYGATVVERNYRPGR